YFFFSLLVSFYFILFFVFFVFVFFFFFSSRRRHTRFSRDWSSDVCSSDLRIGRSSVNFTQSSTRYMRSSLPRENWFSSSHSRSELMVRKSSTVICSLRGSGLASGSRSLK